MGQIEYITKSRKGKHLTYEERIKIETLLREKMSEKDIALRLGRSTRTIRRERMRGLVTLLNSDLTERVEYSADVGQHKYELLGQNKGPGLKIGKDHELVAHLEDKIIRENYSPYAALESAKTSGKVFKTTICVKTLYSYIDRGLFLHLTNADLPVKKSTRKPKSGKPRTAINNKTGTSISERPAEIDDRMEYGHWEQDTVVGKQGTKSALFVMTERKTREEIIFKIESKSQECVLACIDSLERRYGRKFYDKFKTITCDNGCENLDHESLERSIRRKQKRTKIYYAHP